MKTNQDQFGFTLIEIMIVIAIIAAATAGIALSFQQVQRSRYRAEVTRVMGSLQYASQLAKSSGKTYRWVYNFADKTLFLEKTKAVLRKIPVDNDKEKADLARAQMNPYFPFLPSVQSVDFTPVEPSEFTKIMLENAQIPYIKLEARETKYEAIKAERAYIYFFPNGHTENADLCLVNVKQKESQLELLLDAFTAKIEQRRPCKSL